jgi:hypothetical protein
MLDGSRAMQLSWDLSLLLRFLLLSLVVLRNNFRPLPWFTFYLSMVVTKALALNVVYSVWGINSREAFDIAWASQAIVTLARALAVAEICSLMFAGYRGVWLLVRRVLLVCAAVVLSYAALGSQNAWSRAVFNANRGTELAVATVIVALFVFLRHYHVTASPILRTIALGFCLYSCFAVLNYGLLEQSPKQFYFLWNWLDLSTFTACLLLWIWALRKSIPWPILNPMLMPASVYRQLSPEINLRLRLLNERLCRFWDVEVPRPWISPSSSSSRS